MTSSPLKRMTRVESAPFKITLSVLGQIESTIGMLPPEHGGVLGGRPEAGVVTEFYFDRAASRSAVTYTPDNHLLNRLFAEDWNPKGIRVMGFVHSHPGLVRPSQGDLSYSQRILLAIPDLERLLTPIVISSADAGQFQIHPYAVVRDEEGVDVIALEMVVLDGEGRRVAHPEYEIVAPRVTKPTAEPESKSRSAGAAPEGGAPAPVPATADKDVTVNKQADSVPEAFRRVVHAYDLDLMRRTRVIYVGTGGAAGFIEDLARAGVGQHVLIDPDIVAETNLATQQTYRRDFGRAKVDAIADRIRDINPESLVVSLKRSLDDINDQELEFYAKAQTESWAVSQSLICGLTDSFFAQARVNRLALHFGLPSLCAQVYREGRGAEVTFTHPDVTPACHRCALSSRYRAYLDGGFKNTVTSDGTPIFATTRLNALKGFVAMALLHHGSPDPRWGGLLKRIGNRNLIQVRLDPDLATTVGLRVFDRVFERADGDRILFDETVWLPQAPEGPSPGTPLCPDCRGTGNLRDLVGTFSDTRTMRE